MMSYCCVIKYPHSYPRRGGLCISSDGCSTCKTLPAGWPARPAGPYKENRFPALFPAASGGICSALVFYNCEMPAPNLAERPPNKYKNQIIEWFFGAVFKYFIFFRGQILRWNQILHVLVRSNLKKVKYEPVSWPYTLFSILSNIFFIKNH